MSNQPQTKNQTESEFFNLAGTGRKGIEDMFHKMGDEIKAVSTPNISKDFDTWKIRALVEIANDDNLKGIIGTRAGIFSIYQGIAKAATMGLQIGGQFPHAYFVPMGGKAVLIPSQDGYSFMATYGPGRVLKIAPELHEVHEKDEFRIDDAARTYVHNFKPFGDRGKLVGFFTVLEYVDGRKMIPYVTMSQVEEIEQGYGNLSSPAYKKSKLDMDKKTAMKKLLKPVAKEAEGLAMMMALDDWQYAPPVEPIGPDMRDVTERVGDRLDSAAEGMQPQEQGNVHEGVQAGAASDGRQSTPRSGSSRQEEPPKPIQPEPKKEPGDLF